MRGTPDAGATSPSTRTPACERSLAQIRRGRCLRGGRPAAGAVAATRARCRARCYCVAVLIAAWFAGLGPGAAAAASWRRWRSTTLHAPLHSFKLDAHQLPRLALVRSARRRSWHGSAPARGRPKTRSRQARDELEARVHERTAELQQTNEQLQSEITERRRAEEALEDLAGRLIHAQEEERSRIGRELHDHISQMLGVLTIRIDQLRSAGATPADARPRAR